MSKVQPVILIVDDEPGNQVVLEALLIGKGYHLFFANNYQTTFEFVNSILPDLILLDILLPEMNGYDICQNIRQQERLKDIPIIFITTLGNPLDRQRGFEVGGNDFISKPFKSQELLACIKNYLAMQQTSTQ